MSTQRQIYINKRSPGTVQLAQLLQAIVKATQGKTVAFVGLDEFGEPTEVNEYCTMFVEDFPCEGFCWKTEHEPPITPHVTIVTPSLVARICTGPKCGAFFYLDLIDAPNVASLPYDIQKEAMRENDVWFKKAMQTKEIRKRVERKRRSSREANRKRRAADANKQKTNQE